MNSVEYLENILEQVEPFTIAEATSKTKNAFDMLCVVNYLLYDIIDAIYYEQETERDHETFEKLQKIKDDILEIKNKYAN